VFQTNKRYKNYRVVAAFIFQKTNYIHQNAVEAGIVERPEDYLYSSAKDYFHTKKCGLLDLVFL
jgi:REP-associated tyrosine transposase